MKKVFTVLCAMLALASCSKDEQPSAPHLGAKDGKIEVSLSAEVAELESLKSITLTPSGSKLISKIEGQDKVRVLCFFYDAAGNKAYKELDFSVSSSGKQLQYDGRLQLSTTLSSPPIKMAAFIGLTHDGSGTGTFTASSTAIKLTPGRAVTGLQIPFQSKDNTLTLKPGTRTLSNKTIKFTPLGFFLKVKFKNTSGATRIIQNANIANMSSVSVTQSSSGEPKFSYPPNPRLLSFGGSITLTDGQTTPEDYLIYCAKTSITDGKVRQLSLNHDRTGGGSGTLGEWAITDFTDSGRAYTDGKVYHKTISIKGIHIPPYYIGPMAIGTLAPNAARGNKYFFTGQWSVGNYPEFMNTKNAYKATGSRLLTAFFRIPDIARWNVPGYHIPTEEELRAILPNSSDFMPGNFDFTNEPRKKYVLESAETIEVAGQKFLTGVEWVFERDMGKREYFAQAIRYGAIPEGKNLYSEQAIHDNNGRCAIRYGGSSESEPASQTGAMGGFRVYCRYIGNDPSIRSVRDIERKPLSWFQEAGKGYTYTLPLTGTYYFSERRTVVEDGQYFLNMPYQRSHITGFHTSDANNLLGTKLPILPYPPNILGTIVLGYYLHQYRPAIAFKDN